MRDSIREYFRNKSDAKDSVMKAFYAYHAPHFRLMSGAHGFTSIQRWSACSFCGRTREQVRHDELAAKCQNYPTIEDIKAVIEREEQRALECLSKAKTIVLKIKGPLDESKLQWLWETHGIDSETALATKIP